MATIHIHIILLGNNKTPIACLTMESYVSEILLSFLIMKTMAAAMWCLDTTGIVSMSIRKVERRIKSSGIMR